MYKFRLLILVLSVVVLGGAAFVLANPEVLHGQTTPSIEVSTNPNPVLTGSGVTLNPAQIVQNETVRISVEAYDVSGIGSVTVTIQNPGSTQAAGQVTLYDDGIHGDGAASDGVFSNTWNAGNKADGLYPIDVVLTDRLNNTVTIAGVVRLAIGVGACAVDTDCTTAGERCCSGSCAANTCTSNSECNDNDPSTSDTCSTTTCPAICTNTVITQCLNNDDYCPSSCTSANDSDCGDTTVPSIAFVYPNNDNDELNTATFQVVAEATDPESGIDRVEFFLDSETAPRDTQYFDSPAGSTFYNWIFDLAGVSNGSHTLTIRAFNGVSLSATAVRPVIVNRTTTAPFSVAITSPAAGTTFSASTTFSAIVSAQDDISVTEVRVYSSNGGGPIGQVTTSGTSVNIAVPVLAGAIAFAYDPYQMIAQESERPWFTFIPVAHAATSTTTNGNCTTTTNTDPRSIYAMAYDADGNATPSSQLGIIVSTSTTNCVSTNATTQPTNPQI
ncbi:MAG: Ig-like domain-containing protein [Patescibacteria group bacterium]